MIGTAKDRSPNVNVIINKLDYANRIPLATCRIEDIVPENVLCSDEQAVGSYKETRSDEVKFPLRVISDYREHRPICKCFPAVTRSGFVCSWGSRPSSAKLPRFHVNTILPVFVWLNRELRFAAGSLYHLTIRSV